MGLEVLVIAFILYVLGDTATKGKLTAIMKGTTKGVAKETGRAAVAGVKRAHADKIAYLESGKAPLGRTRRRVGKAATGVREATWRGAVDGVRAELEQLRTAIDAARAEAEQARAAAQDPAQGVTRGKFGHSFDVAPAQSGTGDDVQPRSRAEAIKGFGDYADAFDAAAAADALGDPPGSHRPTASDATAPGTTPEGITDMGTMTTATAGAGGPHVEVNSLPGFISACEVIAKLIDDVSEQATGFGLKPQAQTGLVDAGGTMRAVAQSARDTYSRLIEAADGTPQGAEDVTVGAAKSQ